MNRGSEWIKVDFHIHTLGTQKNDQFKQRSRSEFYDYFFKKALENDIRMIGITDYFSIKNYLIALEELKKIINSTTDETEKKYYEKLILFPNVELRLEPITKKNKSVNIHCLFSPEIVQELEDKFFQEIKFMNKYKMNEKGITDYGKTFFDKKVSDEIAYKRGIENFVVSLKDLQKIKLELKDNVLIGASNSSNDGVSGLNFTDSEISNDGIVREIYKTLDFIFSGNENDRDYFLDKKKGVNKGDINKYGGKKPCFHGSDAHTEEKIFKPDLDRYCWIKAEPTFEGIKQVLCEPEDRVRIQKDKPEEKKDYDVIDNISFLDESGEEIKIYLNQNLNTIIGGKSTGKSLLLKNIVNKEKPEEIKEKSVGEFLKLKEFKVNWRDNIIAPNRNIEYIPQSYLNKILYEKNKENEIDKRASEILLKNFKNKEALETLESEISKQEKINYKKIEEYFSTKNNIKKLQEEIFNLGDKASLKNEIRKIKEIISKIKEDSKLTFEEEKQFENKSNELKKIEGELFIKKRKLTEIEFSDLNDEIFNNNFIKSIKEFELKEIEKIVIETKNKIIETLNSIKIQLEKENIEKEEQVLFFKNEIEKFQDKIKEKEKLKKIEEDLRNEETKIFKIEILEKEVQNLKEKQQKLENELVEAVENFNKIYIKNINENFEKITKETLEITINYIFGWNNWKNIYECLDGRYISKEYLESKDKIPDLNKIKNLIKDIITENIKIKPSLKLEEVLKRIVKNNYIIKYEVIENGNDIKHMSEGNKAFVLLEMIIFLEDKKYPILIDQPEDDLDNRSIYEGLVKFLKEKKKERQIIVATHNANVVVGADSENVIVANQHGINTENNKNIKFNYKNGGIESLKIDVNKGILEKKTIQEHICEILEGGKEAFELRKKKYKF